VQLGLPFGDATAERHAAPPPDLYFVRHRRARRYLLRVDHEGRVRVTIPRGGSRREAEAFLLRNREWVARERARFAIGPTISADERRALRRAANEQLPPRLTALAASLDLSERLTRITIRNQRTRWGSCGRDGHITLNWRLMLMPDWVRDYVLVHELMHLRRMDHSLQYWALVEAAYPNYRAARAWLRANGRALR
jgi:predicted metal-dependent hydrolase